MLEIMEFEVLDIEPKTKGITGECGVYKKVVVGHSEFIKELDKMLLKADWSKLNK